MTQTKTSLNLKGTFIIHKFRDEVHADAYKKGNANPLETIVAQNGFLNTGITELWNILSGASANVFSHANCELGVGDSSTAFSATQTDLQASTNKTYQAVDSGFPSVASQTMTLQATFGSSAANYAWNELVLKNTASSICLDRVVQAFGTKATGTAWIAQIAITAS